MTTDLDDFELLPANLRGEKTPDNITFAVYINSRKECQINIKIGCNIAELMSLTVGDKVEFCYNIGKRQILLRKGERGYRLRADLSFRRSITRGWHLEPFPMKSMSAIAFDIITLEEDKIIVQLPKEIMHD